MSHIDFSRTNPDTVLDMIAEAEGELCMLAFDNPANEQLRLAAAAARVALETYAKAIGVYREPPAVQ